jgi:WhiB family redox-sensing transcriptional regulator
MGAKESSEPIYFGIKKQAVGPYNKLRDAQEEFQDWNCRSNPYYYVDYDGYEPEDKERNGSPVPLTIDQCEALCAGCPLLKLCYDFAVANDERHGIWGGIDFGALQDEDKLF